MENNELITALRELKNKIEESQAIATKTKEVTQQMLENQFAHMIEANPKLYGQHGLKRHWLERMADKYGISYDDKYDHMDPTDEIKNNE